MWFKNLQMYRLPQPWVISQEQLEAFLLPRAMTPATGLTLQHHGWTSPRDNGSLVHCVNRQFFLVYSNEKKLLPASVINQVSKAKAQVLEEQLGFAPGRKQMKEIKEQVTDELLPRAFSILRHTGVWIDPVHGWLVIDAATPARADEVIKLLVESVKHLPLRALRVQQSPTTAMTQWLATNHAPKNFSIDQEAELQSTGEGKATVRYVRHVLEAEEIKQHIANGKQCTRLALTWSGRVSFVLTESLTIKRVAALEVIKEGHDKKASDDEERFNTDMALMSGELHLLIESLVSSLGDELPEQAAA